MADATNNGGNPTDPSQNAPITFSEEQKTVITSLIEDRLNRANNKHKEALEAALAAKEAEYASKITELQEKLKNAAKGGEPLSEAEKEQYKNLLEAEKRATVAERQLREQTENRIKEVEAASAKLLKDVAIRDAIFDHDNFAFVDANVVKTLTEGSITWDSELETFVVKDEKGVVRQNSSLQPMTLKEFFAEFGAKHPYLVAGKAKGGTGAGESNRTMSGGLAKVTSRADLKTSKEKSDFISKFGLTAWEALPSK